MTRRAFVASLAFLAFTSLGLPDGLLGVSWPSMSCAFAVPLDALGLLIAATIAGYLLSSFLSGAILRVLPLGKVLALSTAMAAGSLLMVALAPVWQGVVVFAFVAGLGGGAVDAGLNAYGAAHFSARTLNWLHACFGLGTTLGPLIVTTVLGAGLEWRWSYALIGTAQALLAVTFFLTCDRWRPTEGRADAILLATASSLETLRRPVVWAASGLGAAIVTMFVGFLADYAGLKVVGASLLALTLTLAFAYEAFVRG